jgi:tripartite-type tricarboxylate transporter receptor subunit TctC
MRYCSVILTFVLLLLVSSKTYSAQFDPTKKSIEIVVPYGTGGATTKLAHVISEIFSDRGWKSIVVNRPGGDNVIASTYVAESAPNGYTLLMGGNGFTDKLIAGQKGSINLSYSRSNFTPVVLLGKSPAVLIAGADTPVNNYSEFKEYVKNNPKKFNLGFWYNSKILSAWAKEENLPEPTIVLYKGSAQQTTDLLGGHISFTVDNFANVVQLIQAKKVKVLAVLDSTGSRLVSRVDPDAQPFIIGKKYPDLDIPIWFGLFTVAGTPPATVNKINQVLNDAFQDPYYIKNFNALYIHESGGSANDLQKMQNSYIKNMSKFIN